MHLLMCPETFLFQNYLNMRSLYLIPYAFQLINNYAFKNNAAEYNSLEFGVS